MSGRAEEGKTARARVRDGEDQPGPTSPIRWGPGPCVDREAGVRLDPLRWGISGRPARLSGEPA